MLGVAGLLTAGATALFALGVATDYAYGGADAATEYLEDAGYSKVVHTNTELRTPLNLFMLQGCEKGDMAKYSFEATAPNGKHHVSRIVCKGLISGPTIH